MGIANTSDNPSYVERLWPSAWIWVVSLCAVAAVAIAYGSWLGSGAGVAVAAVGAVLAAIAITRWAPRVAVDSTGLRAGRAELPWSCVGRVWALDGAGTAAARGPSGDPTAYMLLRPGVGPGSVVVEVVDPEDPHATWLLATRHPRALARAIEAARGSLGA